MPKPRNNIARLSHEHRLTVLELLLDGATYDQVRDALREAGVPDAALPHNSSFQAYMAGAEYKTALADAMQWRRKAAEKRLLADALATGGGASGVLDLALYEAAEQLRASLPAMEDGKSLANVTNALRGLKSVILAQAKDDRNAEIDRLKSDHAAAISAKDAEIAKLQERCNALEASMQKKAVVVDPNQRAIALAAVDEFVGGPKR